MKLISWLTVEVLSCFAIIRFNSTWNDSRDETLAKRDERSRKGSDWGQFVASKVGHLSELWSDNELTEVILNVKLRSLSDKYLSYFVAERRPSIRASSSSVKHRNFKYFILCYWDINLTAIILSCKSNMHGKCLNQLPLSDKIILEK